MNFIWNLFNLAFMVLLNLYIAASVTLLLVFSILIIYKLIVMSEIVDQLKASLASANEKVAKVAADVAALHAKIDALPNLPELEEVKTMAADLNASLQAVDDSTPDEPQA